MYALVFNGVHRFGHFIHHGHAETILNRPHAVQVEEGQAVAILESVVKIWLQSRHGAQFTVDKGD